MKVRTHHNRYPSGAITPKTNWRLYAGNPLAPLRRKQIGSYTPEIDSIPSALRGLGRLGHSYLLKTPAKPHLADAGEAEHKWASGFSGEQHAATHWANLLDDRWTLISGYLSRRGEVDQILVGPGGVFAIEIKNLNGVIHCDGDRWWRDKYDRYGNLVREGELIEDRAGRSPSVQLNEVADALEAELKRRGLAVGVTRAIALTHPRSATGNLHDLKVNHVGQIQAYGHEPFQSNAALSDAKASEIVTAIAHDHASRMLRRRRDSTQREGDSPGRADVRLPGLNWPFILWLLVIACAGLASWHWTKNPSPLFPVLMIFAGWQIWRHPLLRRIAKVLFFAAPWLLLAGRFILGYDPPGFSATGLLLIMQAVHGIFRWAHRGPIHWPAVAGVILADADARANADMRRRR